MAPPKLHEFSVLLERDGIRTPWGIRLVGGCDFDVPLIITKVVIRTSSFRRAFCMKYKRKTGKTNVRQYIESQVQSGSPAQGQVLRGDIITKIRDYDARDLTHQDANNLFTSSVSSIPLVVRR